MCSVDKGITRLQTFQPQGKLPHFMVRFKEAYEREMQAFVDCVLDSTPPSVTEDDAIKAFKIALAATQSAGEKQCVTID